MKSNSLRQKRPEPRLHQRLLGLLVVMVIGVLFVAGRNDCGTILFAADDDQAKPEVLISVSISPEARVKASAEGAPRVLQQAKWTEFTVTIENTAGITSPLVIECEQLMKHESDVSRARWLRIEWESEEPLTGALQETRRLRIWSRDHGIRSAVLNFNAGQGTQDLGFRSDVLLSFQVTSGVK
ncbi:MAG: hypothetical protein JNL67_21280 [Planctomycetaceae bacterium]|nr:hypothetical protein [Planctomycetaceae bacterium]